MHPQFQKGAGQIIRDTSSADDDNITDPVGFDPDGMEETEDFRPVPGDLDPVGFFDLVFPGRNDHFAVFFHDGTDQNLRVDPPQIFQYHPCQRTAFRHVKFQHLRLPAGKLVHFDHGRELQHPDHFLRAGRVRIHRHTQPQVILDQGEDIVVLWIPHPGDGVAGSQFPPCQTGKNVLLIRLRHRDQKIGFLDPGLPERGNGRPVATDSENIRPFHDRCNLLLRHIDDGHIVFICRQLFSQRGSHASASNYDNIHTFLSCCCPQSDQ